MVPLALQGGPSFSGFQVQPLFEDYGIPLALMGIFVVFMALLLVSVFISILPRIVARMNGRPRKDETRRAPAKSKDELPEELVVVIAAAVAEAISEPHRIIHTRELSPQDLAWSLEGRREHHTSHKTTRDRW